MPQVQKNPADDVQTRPWYTYPWPWVAIAIPALAVIQGLLTLYLAITHPDPLVIDSDEYQRVHATLHAQGDSQDVQTAESNGRQQHDGAR
jgi:hypothetical protein